MELRHLDSIAAAINPAVRRLDAAPSVFVENELKQILPQLYNREFPELEANRVVPAGGLPVTPGATSFAYASMDQRGKAKWIAAGSTDVPRVDVSKELFTFPVLPFAVAYGWTVQEIMSAQFAGIPLSALKAEAAMQAAAEFEDEAILQGNEGLRIPGVLTNKKVPRVSVPNGDWDNATPDQIIQDLHFVISKPWLTTKNIRKPNTVQLPDTLFMKLMTTRLTDTGDTLMTFLRKAFPGVAFESCRALNTAGPDGVARALLAYERSPSVQTSVTPLPFTALEPQMEGFEVLVNNWQLSGGAVWIRPMGGCFGDGI